MYLALSYIFDPQLKLCDILCEKVAFHAKVEFAIIMPKVGVVSFGNFYCSTRGDSRITYRAAGANASTIRT